jgi:lipopolysaccharide export system permease protein
VKLLHRYILRELLGPAALGLLVFTFVLLLRELFDIIDLIVIRGVDPEMVLRLLLLFIPQILAVTIPMAMLIASLLSFGRLATDREVMAMRTSGLHLIWLVSPAVVLGSVLSVGLTVLSLEVVPRLNVQLTHLQYRLLFQSVASLEPGRIYEDFAAGGQEMRFMFDEAGEDPGEMRGVQIFSAHRSPSTGQENLIFLFANRGAIIPEEENLAILIRLMDGEVQISPRDVINPPLRTIRFESLEQRLYPELRRIRGGRYVASPSEMGVGELAEAIAAATDDEDRAKLRVEYHRRWVFPFSALAFTLIGIPFGILTRASGKGVGFAISLVLILLYYGVFEWGTAVAITGSSLAGLAMWSPNILLGIVGVAMLTWVSRQ